MPGEDIDITSDLVDGSDGALGDNLPVNDGVSHTSHERPSAPDGTVHVNDIPVKGEKQEGEFNLRDQLSNAFKGEPDKAEPPAKVEDKPTEYTGPQLTQDSAGKWRTPDGLFASAEQVQAFEAAKAAPAVTNEPDFTSVMANMTPVEQELFKAAPKEIQEFLGRTMETLNGQAARYQEYGLLEQMIAPRRDAWAQNGMTSAVALNQLFALSDFASNQPKDFVLWFAEQNGVDLDAALDERDLQAQNVDPAISQLQGQVNQLTSMLNQQQNGVVQPQQQEMVATVEAFALEKDEAGKLKRPYLAQVNDTWPVHIQSVRQANPNMPPQEVLQKAYENACWANPAVRNNMQQEAQRAAQANARQQAERARAAGASITGGPNGRGMTQNEQNSNLSLRDELAQQFAAARA